MDRIFNKTIITILADKYEFHQNVQSELRTENSKIYLLQTINAEKIGINPLLKIGAYTISDILIEENNETKYLRVRQSSLPYGVEKEKKYSFQKNFSHKKTVLKYKTNKVNFNEIKNNLEKEIYFKLKYEIDGKKYDLVQKADYLNISYQNKFIQIAIKETVIFLNNKLMIARAAIYMDDKKNISANFLVSKLNPPFRNANNFGIRRTLNKLFNFLIPNLKLHEKNDFINVKVDELTFFSIENREK